VDSFESLVIQELKEIKSSVANLDKKLEDKIISLYEKMEHDNAPTILHITKVEMIGRGIAKTFTYLVLPIMLTLVGFFLT
jgi:hypothetical protein